ncbi:hypothetical protein FF098_015835 [Parvularcula flava]|uniref:Uncharacterized protein n=1 Tax=Aquisalinus luteolus TaxID=1566827 RepID=A0A8J3ES05_9PROT|nr:hypothetical protein [Aquisalinus luteolus]NHK29386.1 hypothetical protein [Aquisalinus luteolus]GGI00930.1 hypothetical protein GCM10011355_30370 [Aquisalinus luteolus]
MPNKTKSVVTYLNTKGTSRRPAKRTTDSRIRTPALDENFIGKHRNNPKGEEAVRGYGQGQWNELNADLLRQAEMDCADIDKRVAHSEKCLSQAERKLSETSRFIKRVANSGTALSNGNLFTGTKLRDWQMQDKVTAGICAAMAVILMIMGMVNATSLMLNSAVTVFLDHPWMAMVMSFLVPASSLAVKFVYDFFDTDRLRKLYAWGVYGIAFAMLLGWIILFSGTYGGLTGDIDWGSLGETGRGSKGSLLTAVQLFAEVMAGAALFLVVSTVASKYSADSYYANPEWDDARKAKVDCEETHKALIEEQKKAHGFRDELHAARFVFIERSAADWFSLQGREH